MIIAEWIEPVGRCVSYHVAYLPEHDNNWRLEYTFEFMVTCLQSHSLLENWAMCCMAHFWTY